MDPYAAPELVYRPGPSLSIAIAVITVAFASPNLKTIRCLILLEPLRVIAAPHPPGPPPRTHPARRPTPPGDPHPTLPPGLRPKCQQRAAPQPRSPRAGWRSGACLAGRREELVVAACACVCSGPSFLQPQHTHALTTASTSMRDAGYDDEAPSPRVYHLCTCSSCPIPVQLAPCPCPSLRNTSTSLSFTRMRCNANATCDGGGCSKSSSESTVSMRMVTRGTS